jgi:polysaccharide pyruvyl transferase CsaB
MKVFLTGYYGFKNLGDELILAKIIQDIKAAYSEAEIVLHTANKKFSQQIHDVQKLVDRFSPTETTEAVRECDYVILGGGGLINEYYPIDPKDFFLNFGTGIASYAIVPLLAKIYRKPVFYWSHGLGPLFSEEGKNFASWFYLLADVVTLRDEDSFTLLKTICPEIKNVFLDMDPVITLEVSRYIKPQNIKLPEHKRALGVNVRPWFGTESMIDNLADALTTYCQGQDDIAIVPIPFDLAIDTGVLRNLIDKVPKQFVFDYGHENLETPEQVISIMKQLDFFLGTRLHSIIVSQLLRLPTLSISYDQKTDAFARLRNIPAISIQKFRMEDIVNQLKVISNSIIESSNTIEFNYRTPQYFKAFVENNQLPCAVQQSVPASIIEERELYAKNRHIEGLIQELAELRDKYNGLLCKHSRLMSETQKSKLWKFRACLKNIKNNLLCRS